MRAFRADGIHYAGLDVDSENLSGAVRLYTGLGYVARHQVRQFHKEL
jgi:ribosomal protein S18 acetylase RimI-like enzyme